MESNCQNCSSAETAEISCCLNLQGLFHNYEDIKGEDIEFAAIGEDFGGRLLQYHQGASLAEFLEVLRF